MMGPEEVEEMKERTIVGLTENITVQSNVKKKDLIARIDTGATKSSIDLTLASELKLGPVVDSRIVKSAQGVRLRPVVEAEITIHGKKIKAKFTIADRNHMRYPVLLGQNILKQGFLVDPCRRVDLPMRANKEGKEDHS